MTTRPDEDLLSDILSTYQLRAVVIDTPRMCGAWQLSTAGEKRAAFHWLGEGPGFLHMRTLREPLPLGAGDLVVFPHDAWHMISGEPELRGEDDREVMEGQGPITNVVCGYFDFMSGARNALVDALPEVMLVRAADGGELLRKLGELLLEEAQHMAVGRQALLNKLSDALFVLTLRHYIATAEQPQGLVAALADPRLRRVLGALHREPQRDWSLEHMARLALMSRTAFAQRFAALVGQTPVQYLTHHRMMLALRWLQDEFCAVKDIAGRLGYETEAAFRRAFKRVHGVGPGQLRRQGRAT
jgi:AraC family transcriptional regulator, activator of mtrCDE